MRVGSSVTASARSQRATTARNWLETTQENHRSRAFEGAGAAPARRPRPTRICASAPRPFPPLLLPSDHGETRRRERSEAPALSSGMEPGRLCARKGSSPEARLDFGTGQVRTRERRGGRRGDPERGEAERKVLPTVARRVRRGARGRGEVGRGHRGGVSRAPRGAAEAQRGRAAFQGPYRRVQLLWRLCMHMHMCMRTFFVLFFSLARPLFVL